MKKINEKMKMKNRLKIIILGFISLLLIAPLINAHALEKGPVVLNTTNYDIEFTTISKYPVINRETILDFDIINREEKLLSNLNVSLKLINKNNNEINLKLVEAEKDRGHYNIKYNFLESGDYQIYVFINDKKLDGKINLVVDSLGLSGFLRGGFIILLILIILGFILRECRKK